MRPADARDVLGDPDLLSVITEHGTAADNTQLCTALEGRVAVRRCHGQGLALLQTKGLFPPPGKLTRIGVGKVGCVHAQPTQAAQVPPCPCRR